MSELKRLQRERDDLIRQLRADGVADPTSDPRARQLATRYAEVKLAKAVPAWRDDRPRTAPAPDSRKAEREAEKAAYRRARRRVIGFGLVTGLIRGWQK